MSILITTEEITIDCADCRVIERTIETMIIAIPTKYLPDDHSKFWHSKNIKIDLVSDEDINPIFSADSFSVRMELDSYSILAFFK